MVGYGRGKRMGDKTCGLGSWEMIGRCRALIPQRREDREGVFGLRLLGGSHPHSARQP